MAKNSVTTLAMTVKVKFSLTTYNRTTVTMIAGKEIHQVSKTTFALIAFKKINLLLKTITCFST